MKKWTIAAAAIVAGLIAWQLISSAAFIMLYANTSTTANDPCQQTEVTGPMTGPVRLPVTGSYAATSEYGMRVNPGNIGNGDIWFHDGIDLAMLDRNGPVVAIAAGVVTKAQNGYMEGNYVEINHGEGISTRVMHLQQILVEPNEKVWPGRVIGLQGMTGNTNGEHVHFTILKDGRHTEPRAWMKSRGITIGQGGTAPAPVDSPTAQTQVQAEIRPGINTKQTQGPALLSAQLPTSIGVWKGEQIVNAAHIIAVGQRRKLSVAAITIGVMTAIGESSLRNINHGDAVRNDTIGLFQNGPERGSYAKRMDPQGAAEIFFDHLVKVPNYLDLPPTIAAHKTQRNADPYHYARFWSDAVTIVATLTKDPQLLAKLPGRTLDGCDKPQPSPAASGDVAAAARRWLGMPYSWGGGNAAGPSTGIYTSPALDGTSTVGFDCSGLVLHAVAVSTGITLPHSAELQGTDERGTSIARDFKAMKPGDVISFSGDGSAAAGSFAHVGIYVGEGQMIHAPSVGDVVKVESLHQRYWRKMAWRIKRFHPGTT